MATQIVMNHSGDTRHVFDANDAKALLEAESALQRTNRRWLHSGNSDCFRGTSRDA